jgi:multidrug efflux pump subunit AcrA (membrane-fusion protein)
MTSRALSVAAALLLVSLWPLRPAQGQDDKVLTLPGQVQAAEQTNVSTRIAGAVQKWFADIGDQVRKGQVLAELAVPEIDAELKGQQARLVLAEAKLEQARYAVVIQDAAVLVARARLHEAEATVRQAEAALKQRQIDTERMQTLADKKLIDQGLLDEKVAQLQAAKVAVEAAAETVKTASAVMEESAAKRQKARGGVKVAEARLLVARAGLDRVQALKSFARIEAPFDGVVYQRNVSTGDIVRPDGATGRALFTITRTERARVIVDVPEASAPQITRGTKVTVTLPALGKRKIEGQVTRTAGALNLRNKTLRVEIDLPSLEGKLLPGMSASVDIAVGDEPGK